jgi:hypothetical protein
MPFSFQLMSFSYRPVTVASGENVIEMTSSFREGNKPLQNPLDSPAFLEYSYSKTLQDAASLGWDRYERAKFWAI